MRLEIAFAGICDIANSFVISFLPFPLVFASHYFATNERWLWFYTVVVGWAVIAVAWCVLVSVASFTIPRCSLRIGDPTGADVITPVRSAVVALFHCFVQFFMYRYVYG
ncbi:MAG: hypothetical protein AAGG48_32100 [Planctomycetota bacterium]